MVCTAKDFLEWKNFPKGLKVLLLDKDVSYSSEIRSKLEGMNYVVSTFYHEDEALSAVLNKFEVFHVAIVEVSTTDYNGNFKFLRMAKDLPTIMVTNAQCMTTTLKCIELGAIEVLNKPLCEDKLCNIWQHVVHKAYTAGESDKTGLPTPVNKEVQCLSDDRCDYDEYPAPLTPQLKRVRLQDDAGCTDGTNWSSERDSVEHYEETKSVETTCCNAAIDHTPIEPDQLMHDGLIKEENDLADGCKSESDTSPNQKTKLETSPHGGDARMQSKASECRGPCGPKTSRKKMKVDWTSDLHKKFVQAVELLGVEQAIPSRILELMKVEGLTRHNIASHLQKYRMQRRYALPKREERRISLRPKDNMQSSSSYYYQHSPIMTYPPHPVWAQPGSNMAILQAWSSPSYQNWPWKSYKPMKADAWGFPVMPSPHGSYSYNPQNVSTEHCRPPNSHDDRLADAVIDKIIKEAINKPPWVPLPIGLKPPSTESVLVELSKQGISSIPPIKHQLMDYP